MSGKKKEQVITPKQDRFAKEYVVDLNATQAAIRAGYSKKTARQQASRMLSKDYIQATIQKYGRKVDRKVGLSAERILGGLLQNAERCQQGEPVLDKFGQPTGVWRFDAAGSNRAWELLGKNRRLFIDRTELVDVDGVQEYVERICNILTDEINDDPMLRRILTRIMEDAGITFDDK